IHTVRGGSGRLSAATTSQSSSKAGTMADATIKPGMRSVRRIGERPLCGHETVRSGVQFYDPTILEKFNNAVIEIRRSGYIVFVAFRHIDDQPLSRACQKNAVSICQINALRVVIYVIPRCATKFMIAPITIHTPKVGVPAHADPVKLETLSVKFSSRIFKIIGRSDVRFGVEEPVRGIDLLVNIEAFRLETRGARGCDETEAFAAAGLCAKPFF